MSWSAGTISTGPAKEDTFAFKPPAGFQEIAGLAKPEEVQERPAQGADLLVGKPAPEFNLRVLAPEGKEKRVSKSDLAGKVVLLDFWATWCGPCLKELPEIQKLIDSYNKAGKNVAIVAISQDQPPDDPAQLRTLVEKTLAEHKLNIMSGPVGQVALDPTQALGEAFKVEGIPTVFVLDPKGVVQSVHVGFADDVRERLTSEIDTLLGGRSLIESGPKPTPAGPAADGRR
jgi:thiol-disulfide isomerase/thioredoxin